jgi:aspartyl-tRNA(Asn)/glutamyl-tRNA(Gln) amidotransferase subunit B
MEIVSEPDLRSADDAREYFTRLRAILQYIGVNNGDMESGQLRCDANVSLRPLGTTQYGTKVEIKNMNSFRAVHRAIEFEIVRQTEVLDAGGKLVQETRGWNDARGETVSQRSKEYAQDYRYFPEPDLPPLAVSREWVEQISASLPELPAARRARFMTAFELSGYDASLLTSSRTVAEYFETAVRGGAPAKSVANWILGDLSRLRNTGDWDKAGPPTTAEQLVELLTLIDSGQISGKMAKDLVAQVAATGRNPAELVREQGLSQISGDAELIRIVEQVIGENAKSVEDYRAGKQQALGFLVGQAMKLSKGKANPARVNQLLREKLEARGD